MSVLPRSFVAALCVAAMLVSPSVAGAGFAGVNGVIAYQGAGAGGFTASTISFVTPDGAIQRQLTNSGGHPSWSPDGALIAFAAQLANAHVEVMSMAPDGSGRTQLTDRGESPWFPAWSPDGSRLVVGLYRMSVFNYDIWTMKTDGTDAKQLTSGMAEDIDPVWSPGGTKSAFLTDRDGNREIYVLDAGGANPRNLTNRPASDEYGPDWSPDGSKL